MGPQGPQGAQGAAGVDAPAAEYGVATVWVQRGAAVASIWGRYSTRIGSPVGDNTGGVFRFTCNPDKAPCRVSVSAAFLSNAPGAANVHPRVLVQRQSLSGGPQVQCEYGDATATFVTAVGSQPLTSTPVYSPLTVHIGGSADCGGPVPTFGAVSEITVPEGYYDVFTTFTFFKP